MEVFVDKGMREGHTVTFNGEADQEFGKDPGDVQIGTALWLILAYFISGLKVLKKFMVSRIFSVGNSILKRILKAAQSSDWKRSWDLSTSWNWFNYEKKDFATRSSLWF